MSRKNVISAAIDQSEQLPMKSQRHLGVPLALALMRFMNSLKQNTDESNVKQTEGEDVR